MFNVTIDKFVPVVRHSDSGEGIWSLFASRGDDDRERPCGTDAISTVSFLILPPRKSYDRSKGKMTGVMRRLLSFTLYLTILTRATSFQSSASRGDISLKRRLSSHSRYYCSSTDTVTIKTEAEHASFVAESILTAMRRRTAADSLHLAEDLFDESTGLHSEGVWHNALAGITSLRQSQQGHAERIADSLYRYSWDGTSFRRRAYSGKWNHSPIDALEQPNYYLESCEHRCVQHGMALIFWSKLALQDTVDGVYKEQQRVVARQFLDEYWDQAVNRWTTISAFQGGGTVSRPSASANKQTLGVTCDDGKEETYYRAIDQAIGVLACLDHVKVLEQQVPQNQTEIEQVTSIIQSTCAELLTSFGYGNEKHVKTYIGLNRNRNFWHDGWVLLSLSAARYCVWPDLEDHGETELQRLLEKVVERYGHADSNGMLDGTVWHWPKSLKENDDNVRYCGDNALLYAITRNLNWAPAIGLEKYQAGFWEFVELLTSRQDDGLASVADVYKQVRLHPNTELAALLVWP